MKKLAHAHSGGRTAPPFLTNDHKNWGTLIVLNCNLTPKTCIDYHQNHTHNRNTPFQLPMKKFCGYLSSKGIKRGP